MSSVNHSENTENTDASVDAEASEHLRTPEEMPRRRWKKWLLRGLIASLVMLLLAVVSGFLMYRHYVLKHPGAHLERSHIENVMSVESPVYYRDGETKVGVFFEREHRLYVPYDQIPENWIHAITASEDQRYFEHGGLDYRGIMRAMWANVRSGRVVAGGSTLTQQTAKNLYDRKDRSFSSKFTELVNALRLEAHYSKENILEFYANQFHVSANGRGIGIAAKYFFDKTVAQLSLKECAFLAGLVKAPSRYNPFIGSTPELRLKASMRANDRTHYVLERMAGEGYLSADELQEQIAQPLEFKRGYFRYASSVVLDEVEKRLKKEPFRSILADAGLENARDSGLQVITTLDADAQRSAMYGLWHHLTEVGAVMEGVSPEDFWLDARRSPRSKRHQMPDVGSFMPARVLDSKNVDLGGMSCALDQQAHDRIATVFAKSTKGDRWARPTARDRKQVSKILEKDRVVWVSVRRVFKDEIWCDLEQRPELQGAVLLTEAGQVRAMVGGNDNANFNRATTAKRQLGSTWKPLIFQAALHLGWTPLDLLDNRRAVFPFEGTWYYPSPDHKPKDFVSMAWAGTNSENLASIWLLSRLLARLDSDQLITMAELTGFAPGEGESRRAFIRRIRDTNGVIATKHRMRAVALDKAKKRVVSGLDLSPIPEADLARERVELMSLYEGWGFEAERHRRAASPEYLRALEADLRQLSRRGAECEEALFVLRSWLHDQKRDNFLWSWGRESKVEVLDSAAVDVLSGQLVNGRLDLACHRSPEGYLPLGDVLPTTQNELAQLRSSHNPRIDERVHLSTLQLLLEETQEQQLLLEGSDPYALENLVFHPDFQSLMAMRYVSLLAESYGVASELPQVLSMPLGALDISLEESVSLYAGLASGKTNRLGGFHYRDAGVEGLLKSQAVGGFSTPTQLIQEIRDRDGNVLFRAKNEAVAVADSRAARMTVDILANVVEHGTGRRARRSLPELPIAGKTGTTNDFRNAAFVGYAPSKEGLYTLGVYVGYDDNRSMVRGNTRLHGASGALPVWIETVRGLQDAGALGDLGDWQEYQMDSTLFEVPVETSRGVASIQSGADATVLVGGSPSAPHRYFVPLGRDRERLESADYWLWP